MTYNPLLGISVILEARMIARPKKKLS